MFSASESAINYYPFHLGDYAAHTAHLEPMEDLAYRRMLDLYYRTERPLPNDWREIARLIRLRDQSEAIEAVLAEFFTVTDDGWSHSRCEAEITKMKDKQAKARASAQVSVSVRSTNAQRTLSERSADVELPTPTPTPTPTPEASIAPKEHTVRKRTRASLGVSDLVQAGVQQQHAEDWLAVRKAKALPLTATALDQTRAEADLAGLTLDEAVRVAASNSWAGFKAAWVLRPPTGSPGGFVSKQLAIEAHNERVGEEWARKKAIELADQIAQERAEEVRRAGF